MAIVFGFVTVAVATGGFLAVREQRRLQHAAVGFVAAVADFRAEELSRWLFERYGDAEVASRDPILAGAIPGHTSSYRAYTGFALARKRLETITQTYGYEAALLLSREGEPVMEVGRSIDSGTPVLREAIARVHRDPGVKSAHLDFDPATPDRITLVVVAPVVDEGIHAEVVGTLILRIDAARVLLGVLGLAPVATRTGQVTLVAREPQQTVFVFPHRRGSGLPWLQAQPPAQSTAPETLVLGHAGDGASLEQAQNEAGQAVVASAHAVRGAPWTVVGKVDRDELVGLAIRAHWSRVALVASLLLGVALVANDLWRRWSERALRASEDKFRTMFENMQDGYLLSSLDGEILLVNPATVRMLGHEDPGALLGRPQAFAVLGGGAGKTESGSETEAETDGLEWKRELLAKGALHGHQSTYQRADGSRLVIESHVRLVHDQQDQPVAIEAVMRDMSAHYEIRNELIRAREAAVSTAAVKAQFLANVSHEIRTPLNAIVGLGHLIARAPLPLSVRDYVVKMQASVRMLLDVVNNVLDFSKIEAGRLTVEATPFALDEIFDGLSNVLAVQAAGKNIELVCSIAPQVPPGLVGDPTRLGQVLTNLGGNAVKFTSGGEVVIGVHLLRQLAQQVELQFYVRDTGMGMTPDQAAHMMEAFVQADGSTTRRFGGTGLGLAISRQLVELMGGRLTVQSSPGVGSTFSFTITLPVAPKAALPPATGAPPPDWLRDLHVLVVDDNEAARLVLDRHLRDLGMRVQAAASGAEALALLEAAQASDTLPALVLLDLRMPGMDGIETARRIRVAPWSRRPVLVMMSAFARDEAGPELDRLLVKPVTRAGLQQAVTEALAPEGAPSEAAGPAPGSSGALAGARILVAEDNPINQQVARELLEAAGARVQIAATGAQALALINAPEARHDTVLMDLQMPEMDGFEATRAIRRNPARAGLPIIAMTAHAFEEEWHRCVAAGMNDHIAKPVEPAALIATVGKWARASIDRTVGLRRVGNNPTLYRQLLGRFAEQWRQGGPRIAHLAGGSEEDVTEARRLAHTLKGAAGTLGLTLVAETAGQLEEALRAASTGDRSGAPAAEPHLLDQLTSALALACADIDASPPATAATAASLPDRTFDVEATLSELETLLERRNLRAREAVARLHGARLPAHCRVPLARVDNTVARLDYVAAGAALQQLKAALHDGPQDGPGAEDRDR